MEISYGFDKGWCFYGWIHRSTSAFIYLPDGFVQFTMTYKWGRRHSTSRQLSRSQPGKSVGRLSFHWMPSNKGEQHWSKTIQFNSTSHSLSSARANIQLKVCLSKLQKTVQEREGNRKQWNVSHLIHCTVLTNSKNIMQLYKRKRVTPYFHGARE